MAKDNLSQIRKRDGSIVPFDAAKIENAIYKALMATKTGDRKLAADLTAQVVKLVSERIAPAIPTAEPSPYITAESEYAGGCPTGTCPL